jgi:hypothetical protein
MKNVVTVMSLIAAFLAFACSGSNTNGSPPEPSTNQTLNAIGPCAFTACGSLPSSLASTPTVTCSGATTDSCAWSADDQQSASYRQCADSECSPAPEIDCPVGTLRSTQRCGSENGAACLWTTVCTPPRNTTPCPDADGCGPQPEIGVICGDGTNGALVCVSNGTKCGWERNCD